MGRQQETRRILLHQVLATCLFVKLILLGFSNIDNHWLAAGFPENRVLECHGSICYMQCVKHAVGKCQTDIWPTDPKDFAFEVDAVRFSGLRMQRSYRTADHALCQGSTS